MYMGYHNKNKSYGFSAAKPREAEIINEERKEGIISKKNTAVVIAIVVALVFITFIYISIRFGLFDGLKTVKLFSGDEAALNDPEVINVDLSSDSNAGKNVNNSALVSNYSKSTETIKLAILADPDLFDYKNQPVMDCDAIVFAKTEIPKTPKILNATLNLLFNDDFDYGFTPANFISTQKDLNFENAVIENGVAKVYLSGKIGPIENDCDKSRIQNQVTETAKQFTTVKSVEIFLNGIAI